MSNNEDPQERPAEIIQIINGLERYNPEAVGPLETYLQQQCEQRFCDGNANRVLLKLYVSPIHDLVSFCPLPAVVFHDDQFHNTFPIT